MLQIVILLTLVLSSADIASSHFHRGEYEEAANHLERFFTSTTYREDPHRALVLGICYFELHDYNRAEPILTEALRLLEDADKKVESLLMLGVINYQRGEYEVAAGIFEVALSIQTDRLSETLLWMDKSEYGGPDYRKALEYLTRARSMGNVSEISHWYGLTLLRLRDHTGADSLFSSLGHDRFWRVHSLLFRAYVLYLTGLKDNASHVFHTAISIADSSHRPSVAAVARLFLGCINAEKGQYETAITHLDFAKGAVSRKVSDFALLKLGWSQLQLSRFTDAASSFGILLGRTPRSEYWDEACYFLGESRYEDGNYADALKLFDRLLTEAPNSGYAPHALHASACSYYQMDSLSAAIKLFEEYADRWPDSHLIPFVTYRTAMSAYHTGDYLRAIRHLRKLLGDGGGDLTDEALYLSALCHYALSDYDSTLSELSRLREREAPLRVGAQKLVADALFHKEDYWRALEAYRHIARESLAVEIPTDILDHSRYQIERSLLKLGLYSSPVTMLRVYVRKYPQSSTAPRYQMEVAQYYLELGEYRTAKNEFGRYLELFPGHAGEAEALMGLASTYGELEQHGDARREYLKVDESSPLAPRAWLAAADMSLEMGELGRAISEYQIVLETFPESPYAKRALCMQGECFIALQEVDEAMSVHVKLSSTPGETSSCETFAYRLALFLFEQGLVDDALKLLDRTWSTDSLDAQAFLKRGTVLFEIGRFEEAASDLLRASDHLPEDERAEPLYKVGQAFEAVGMREEAYVKYLAALEHAAGRKLRDEISDRIRELRSVFETEESEE